MTEFDFIRRYLQRQQPDRDVVLGIGDDAAIVRPRAGTDWCFSSDMLLAGRHFFADVAPADLAHKVLAVNLSDMAAMGAAPRWVLLSAALPQLDEAWLQAFCDSLFALAAQFGLYQDKKLIICPHAQQDAGALETVETLWQAVGARTYRMSAATHDAIFAAVSHMPHMMAYAYVHQIAEHPDGQTYLDFAASGFRDFTRIASSHPAIWTDICMANKDSLLDLLAGQQQALAYLQNLLQSNDADALYRNFEEAQHTRDDWQARQ